MGRSENRFQIPLLYRKAGQACRKNAPYGKRAHPRRFRLRIRRIAFRRIACKARKDPPSHAGAGGTHFRHPSERRYAPHGVRKVVDRLKLAVQLPRDVLTAYVQSVLGNSTMQRYLRMENHAATGLYEKEQRQRQIDCCSPPPVNRRFFHIKYNHDSEYNSLR